MTGPTTAWPGAMPGRLRAAGLHNVDARARHLWPVPCEQLESVGLFNTQDVGVFLGMDVGKSTHHGHGLTTAGKKVFDKPLPNSEPELRAVFDKLTAKFGTVLVAVDQPASIGALPLAVARDAGCRVAYLPGLAMRRIADLYPGEAKTDAKDAAVIADAARTMPHVLRSLELTDEITAELTVLVGFDQIWPLRPTAPPTGSVACSPSSIPALNGCWAPAGQSSRHLATGAPRLSGSTTQSRTAKACGSDPSQGSADGRAADRRGLRRPRRADRDRPWHQRPRPGDPLTRLFPDGRSPAATRTTAAHLASYAGLAPTTKSSGTSIHGEHAPRSGNRQLKRAMFLSAFAALHDPASRTYYDKCRARGKTHTQALLRLARHRISVLFAMLRDGAFYEPRRPQATAA